jgi:integrase
MSTPAGHTPGHVNCPLCEAARLRVLPPAEFALLHFRDAGRLWLAEKRRDLSEGSIRNYHQHLRWLNEFFGDLSLGEIHIGHVQEYQKWRQEPRYDEVARRTFRAGYSPINHEVSALQQILDRGALWIEVQKFYRPLKQPKARVGQALDPQDQERLFAVAWSNPYWQVAYCAALISINTSASASEVRHLHLSDVDLKTSRLTIRDGLKNEHRDRTTYLNPTAAAALRRLLERAHRLGCRDSEHYLLPHRAHRRGQPADPNRSMGSWKGAWRAMTRAAGLPTLRYHDLRHDIVTRLLENPDISEQTVQEIAGHVSKRIKDRYSHIRMLRKREALEAVEVKASLPQMEFSFEPLLPERKGPVLVTAPRRKVGVH